MATNRLELDVVPKDNSDGTNKTNNTSERSPSIKDENSISSNGSNSINPESNGKESSIDNNITTSSSTTTDSDSKSEEGDSPPVGKKKKKKKNGPDRLARRIKHFRKLFASEIPDELPTLIDTYVCAYQGDILLQGKMYITDRYLCFYSRIINYVTKHVYRWEEIDAVTKERVAFIFPTAIGLKVSDPKRKIIYASFLARDDAYEKLKSIWSQHKSNPNSAGDDDSSIGYDGTPRPADRSSSKTDNPNSTDPNNPSQNNDINAENTRKNKKDKRRYSPSPTPNDDSQQMKTLNSAQLEPSNRNTSVNRKSKLITNENNNDAKKAGRSSRKSKDQTSRNEPPKRGRSSNKNHSQNRSTQRLPSNTATDRVSSEVQPVLYNSSVTSNSNTNTDISSNATTNSSSDTSNTNGISTRALNMFSSFINIIIESVIAWFRYFQTHSTKTTTFVLLLLLVLFFHSIYLIALAYRVENRLHSLNSLWPSSLLKSSLSSNAKQML